MVMHCPNCGASVLLQLIAVSEPSGGDPKVATSASERQYHFSLSGVKFDLKRSDLIAATKDVQRGVQNSFVEIEDETGRMKQFPTKDLLRQAIKRRYPNEDLSRIESSFTSQRAEGIMRGIGLRPKRTVPIA